MFVCLCVNMRGWPERTEASDAPGVAGSCDLQAAVSCPAQVLGTEPRSSARAIYTLNCRVFSPASGLTMQEMKLPD